LVVSFKNEVASGYKAERVLFVEGLAGNEACMHDEGVMTRKTDGVGESTQV
jgi:hypothetical protein